MEQAGNKTVDFKPIYNPLDKPEKIAWDRTKYSIKRIFAVTREITALSSEKRINAYKALQKDLGNTAGWILKWFSLPYLRSPEQRRIQYKINKLRRTFLRMQNERPPKDAEESSKRVDRLQEILRKLLEED